VADHTGYSDLAILSGSGSGRLGERNLVSDSGSLRRITVSAFWQGIIIS
jgi:hypothetical protein